MLKLIIVRGLPGSGKSTLAKALVEGELAETHCEADMYHVDENGEYKFNPAVVSFAHEWCQDRARSSLSLGRSVVVSNTFTRNWEMRPYLKMAKQFGASVQVIECKGKFGNIHNVPENVLQDMITRWEKYIPV